MKIKRPRIEREDGQALYRADVESPDGSATLWYSVDEQFGDLLADTCDGPLIALLIPAMARGEDIQVDGAISERLLYNASRPLQRVLQQLNPRLRPIRIHADHVHAGVSDSGAGVATGFSGGIDSYCVVADHHFADVPRGFKLTHLLFNNVGSHTSGGERLFRKRYGRLVPAARDLGLPFVAVNSNLDSFYDKRLGIQATHTLRNASVALSLQQGIGRFLYASTFRYTDAHIGPTYDIAYGDPIVLPLLSTESLDALSVGSEYSRVGKTLRVADTPHSYTALDVCANARHEGRFTNCSTCWKCLRTLATLEIAGRLESYATVFDLEAYRRRRVEYFARLLGSRDPLLREIIAFAREREFAFPVRSRLVHASAFYPAAELARRAVRKARHLARRFA